MPPLGAFCPSVFGAVFATVMGGCFWLAFWVWVGVRVGCLWGCFGVFWGGVGERERQRRTGKGENAQRLTACGCPCACGCACRPCPCRLFLSVRQCYLFSVDNICRMVGGILQPNGNRKTANSMCPLFHTPTFLSPNTEHIPFGRRFRKPSQ